MGRTTRGQAAKPQSGVYIPFSSDGQQELLHTDEHFWDTGCLKSTLGDRSLSFACGDPLTNQGYVAEAIPSRSLADSCDISQEEIIRPINKAQTTSSAELPIDESISSPVCRSPVKTLEEVERCIPLDEGGKRIETEDDSFVEQIIARSPAKHVSRIEDSVEALDQLEEAIEALDQATLAETIVSPEKTRQKDTTVSNHFPAPMDCRIVPDKPRGERQTKVQNSKQTLKPGYNSMRVKSTTPKAAVVKKATSMVFKPNDNHEPLPMKEREDLPSKSRATVSRRPISMIVKSRPGDEYSKEDIPKTAPVKRPVSLLPPKERVKSAKPVTKPTFELPGEAIARRLKEKKEARLAQRDSSEDSFHTARIVSGSRIKSNKPPTTSTFELPGEAVSRRKREALEARLKTQEEEEGRRREVCDLVNAKRPF